LNIGGQFEAQQQANLRLLVLGSVSVIGVFLLLTKCLGSWRAALQVLANIPLAALGSVVTLLIVNQPSLKLCRQRNGGSGHSLDQCHKPVCGSLGGVHYLIGIVSRNGIMMISHYIHLMEHEGEEFGEEMIIRGSLERLSP
jgi:Cu/Ag efflux pump CusA